MLSALLFLKACDAKLHKIIELHNPTFLVYGTFCILGGLCCQKSSISG